MKKDINIDSFNLDEGTIAFWVKANEFDWGSNEAITLFKISQEEGGVKIVKDKENIMKGIYQRDGEKNETSTDVSGLSKQERHHIAFTWSQEDNKITLYLDGEKIDQENIN